MQARQYELYNLSCVDSWLMAENIVALLCSLYEWCRSITVLSPEMFSINILYRYHNNKWYINLKKQKTREQYVPLSWLLQKAQNTIFQLQMMQKPKLLLFISIIKWVFTTDKSWYLYVSIVYVQNAERRYLFFNNLKMRI